MLSSMEELLGAAGDGLPEEVRNRLQEIHARGLRVREALKPAAGTLFHGIGGAFAALDLAQRSERMQLLSETLGQLISARDPETIVRELFPKVAAHLGVDAYFNFMVDERAGCLRMHSCAGIPDATAKTLTRLEYGQAICGTVAQTRRSIVAEDIQNSGYDKAELVRGWGIQAYACNPLMVGERLLGTLSFASRTRTAFLEDELEFIRTVSQYTAVALDRLQTSEELSDNAKRLSLALVAAKLGDWSWDVATDLMTLSKRAAEIYGVEPGTVHTRAFLRTMLHEDDRERAREEAVAAMTQGTDYDIEYRIHVGSGEERWVAAKGRAEHNAKGEVSVMLGVVQDITERKRSEALLREAKETAESANRAKDHFLAVLSHELRTPLTPVLMAVTDLEHHPGLPADIRGDMAMIHRNVELETKLIDDLLDVSRISSGKLVLRMELVDVNQAVREVCAICASQVVHKSIRLDMDLDGQDCRVQADPARLQQVLWNLLNNAVKFTHAQGHICISTQRLPDRRLRIEVRDNGTGIPADLLPLVFDAFEQGDARLTGLYGGLGLGLAISRALVELHQGTILAESGGRGQGSLFTVVLPMDAANAASQSVELPSASPATEEPPLRLLVVEDHADTARVLSLLLRRAGFVVNLAHSVTAALELAEREPFDLLVSDLGLPDGTGHDLMRQLRSHRPVPGIAMSGFGMEEDLRKSKEAGFSEHLVKPISAQKLEQCIRRIAAAAR